MSDELEVGDGQGTALLARSALTTPLPPPDAEARSRARVLSRIDGGDLRPRALRETPGQAQWLTRLRRALLFWKP